MGVGNAAPYMGYQSAIGVAKETTLGTAVTATCWLEFLSESLKFEREEIKIPAINSTRDYTKRVQGKDTVSGSIEFYLNPAEDACINIIKQAMGGTATNAAAVSTGAYGHTLRCGDMENNKGTSTASDMKGLSFMVRKGSTDTWFYTGCRVDSLSFKGEIGQPVVVTADIIGTGMSITATIGALTLTTIAPALFSGVRIYTGVSMGSASTEEFFTSFELTIKNNLDGDCRALGSRAVAQIPPAMREVSLKLGTRYDTLTSYNRFLGATMVAIKLDIDSGVTVGATNTFTYKATINIPKAYYNSVNTEVGGPGVLSFDVDATALYGSSAGTSIIMSVTNATANYT